MVKISKKLKSQSKSQSNKKINKTRKTTFKLFDKSSSTTKSTSNKLTPKNKLKTIHKLKTKSKTKSKTKTKTITKSKPSDKKTTNIATACNIYKKDLNGKINKVLYNSCKIHKYCRKYNCNDIDNEVKNTLTKKFGNNYPKLLFKYIRSECFGGNRKKKCEQKAIAKLYKENDLTDLHNKLTECDKKTCKKEKDIFYTNLYRHHRQKMRKVEKTISEEDIEPDLEKQ